MMSSSRIPHRGPDHEPGHPGGRSKWASPWTSTWMLISGVLALLWLLLRSGTRPNRFTYPCQQAACAAAMLAFGAPLATALMTVRRKIKGGLLSPLGLSVAAIGLAVTAGTWGWLHRVEAYDGPVLAPSTQYRAEIYHVTNCPQSPVGDHFPGLDNLIAWMGEQGVRFFRSENTSLESGPDGIIGADDVVIIKINYQWSERGGTNVDLLRGLIRRIVDHPDHFDGEIVVCENTQFALPQNFDRPNNNAEDHTLSPHDVVVEFRDLGYRVSQFSWKSIRGRSVDEYSAGDMNDGYIVYPYDSVIHGRISYPKFQTDDGTYISMKYGIWDEATSTYDREHLKFINMPVLKSHHSTYGATICVKHYMGLVTDLLSTNSHSGIHYGLLGAVIGEIGLADLNILDCIWINANPYSGPSTSYSQATRKDELLASLDPVAADIWADANILIPAFYDNGYSPPWPEPSADPYDSTSDFRQYLDHSMYQILDAGYQVTNDLDQIDTYTWDGSVVNDCDSNGIPDEWELPYADCNENGILDACDILDGTSRDAYPRGGDGVPDECQVIGPSTGKRIAPKTP